MVIKLNACQHAPAKIPPHHKRLGWFGHVPMRDSGYIGQTMLNEMLERRKRLGLQKGFMYVVNEDKQMFCMAEEHVGIGWDGSK